ncbi:unnamed protein product [Rotaria magnacalcarata]|uniref:Uncharacterized protein n=1 Tax=Rotaria magnacalcarata TaxID=392030 RepID=A0A818YWZ7_9BILA|nr:unnamed protein product [Rotaria magnacalcarata]
MGLVICWSSSNQISATDIVKFYSTSTSNIQYTFIVAGKTYAIPRGWTRFGVYVDETFAKHHDVWKTWVNCYHGTSIESVKSIVEHRQLLLPRDTTMEGEQWRIREETVGARRRQETICPHRPNDEIEWKTQHRATIMPYALMLCLDNKSDSKVDTKEISTRLETIHSGSIKMLLAVTLYFVSDALVSQAVTTLFENIFPQ